MHDLHSGSPLAIGSPHTLTGCASSASHSVHLLGMRSVYLSVVVHEQHPDAVAQHHGDHGVARQQQQDSRVHGFLAHRLHPNVGKVASPLWFIRENQSCG